MTPRIWNQLLDLRQKSIDKYGPLEDNHRMLGALRLEYREVEEAIQSRDNARVRAELLDLANVALRAVQEMDEREGHGV